MASVWGAAKLSFEERCQMLARIGFKGVDLPTAEQVPIMKQYGLAPGDDDRRRHDASRTA